jgi:hypothetical protein
MRATGSSLNVEQGSLSKSAKCWFAAWHVTSIIIGVINPMVSKPPACATMRCVRDTRRTRPQNRAVRLKQCRRPQISYNGPFGSKQKHKSYLWEIQIIMWGPHVTKKYSATDTTSKARPTRPPKRDRHNTNATRDGQDPRGGRA